MTTKQRAAVERLKADHGMGPKEAYDYLQNQRMSDGGRKAYNTALWDRKTGALKKVRK